MPPAISAMTGNRPQSRRMKPKRRQRQKFNPPFGITWPSYPLQSGTGLEQQGINLAFVLQRKRRKLPRQCENHVDVAGGQQLLFPRCEPAVAGIRLALWAVPVAA
jgi:hypothetical protein